MSARAALIGVDRAAQRSAGREVERNRRHRELLEMRNLQRRRLHFQRADRGKRHLAAGRGRRGQVDRVQRSQRARHRRIDVENDAILVRLGEHGRNDALAVSVVERVVDRRRRDAETRRAGAVDIGDHRPAVGLQVARDIDDLRHFGEARENRRRPCLQRCEILIFQGELILGRADGGVDRQVLDRLHVERNAGDVGGLLLQAADDFAGGRLTIGVRLEVDEETAGIERDVGAVDADERGQAFDVTVGRDRLGQSLLVLGHLAEGNVLRRLGDALDDSGVLHRKEPLRDRDVEISGDEEGRQRDDERRDLMVQHHIERASRKGAAAPGRSGRRSRVCGRPARRRSAAAISSTSSAPASTRRRRK